MRENRPTWLALGLGIIALSATETTQIGPLKNPGFEQGLLGWTAEGEAFRDQPTLGENVVAQRVLHLAVGGDYWSDLPYPIGIEGSRWIGTYDRRPDESVPRGTLQGDLPTGTLISEPFRLSSRYMTFLIAGGEDFARLRVELLPYSPELPPALQTPVQTATGHGDDRFRRQAWDLAGHEGELFQIRIVDHSSAIGGHIQVDDFQFTEDPPAQATAPLWGYADLHTHPMAHLGFGGKLIHGSPDGDIAQALGNCQCTHGGWGLDNRCGNFLRMAIISQVDKDNVHAAGAFQLDHEHAGYPHFKGWPHFTSVTHQQMWHEWIRRSWEGGLRVLVGLAVNNHLLGEGLAGDLSKDDKSAVDRQLKAMKEFAARHSDFMEIADSPAALRSIVQRGKLALILGVEVDNLGNFNFANVDKSEEAVRAEIRRLYAQGVRYLLPIHLTDNAFGGTAVAMDLFNLAQRFNAVQPLPEDPRLWTPGDGLQIESASEDPAIEFRLNSPLDEKTVRTLRLALRFVEAFPYPDPKLPYPTLGRAFSRYREYDILKRFFLVPTPIPPIEGGHRNQKGLTDLGRIAISEMMHLGMMIDFDHTSERAAQDVLALARTSAGAFGYPLFSGHNSFRALNLGTVTEGQRSEGQLSQLRALQGMMGVGSAYERQDEPVRSASAVLREQGVLRMTRSEVSPDCGGSSKTFAQNYLYAVEKVGAVALGTDTNGLVMGPGPRFGRHSRLGGNFCPPEKQESPVRYDTTFGAKSWQGPNAPLRPLKTGTRVWDVNTDGVAHFGLFPDFLQDLRNVGIVADDLSPLFQGAEAFAQRWERTLEASEKVRSAAGDRR